ncbi:UDP-N-acetylglucosamine 2-epimerase (non-hydrolyzing) [Pseudonocardiaceae bacterium YIM PH 21723]|nr:UDP-N-acetylglucosamine 2-epimerase (non-hydrolyzing) [Pseudonocardiaceae bacterium YIM PH 21723]
MKISIVVGVRPHLVKLSALWPVLSAAHDVQIVHTGQHFDHSLNGAFLQEFDLPAPHRQLSTGSGTHAQQVGTAMVQIESALAELRPELAVVIGDTNSSIAAALAAAKSGIPVAHVEAGMRSFDKALPEEINRLAIDAISTLHLCSTTRTRDQLVSEGHRDSVEFVGDLLLDVCLRQQPAALAALARFNSAIPGLAESALVTFHRGATLKDPRLLTEVVEGLLGLDRPLVCVLHPAARRALEDGGLLDRLGHRTVAMLDPLGHTELLALLSGVDRVYTDSSGVQREALFVGTPCFVLRDSTEFRETVELGSGRLVGTDRRRIAASGGDVLSMPSREEVRDYFGGGGAAERIVKAIGALSR